MRPALVAGITPGQARRIQKLWDIHSAFVPRSSGYKQALLATQRYVRSPRGLSDFEIQTGDPPHRSLQEVQVSVRQGGFVWRLNCTERIRQGESGRRSQRWGWRWRSSDSAPENRWLAICQLCPRRA